MTYVFTFLGEFGYELLNWQGTIRKWSKLHKQPEDKIVICSRKGLEQLYEFADEYINISELDSYNNAKISYKQSTRQKYKMDLEF